MKLINTDGMAFIGPGSEWFWTALSGLVLAVTFFLIYRQLSIARSANAFEQMNRINSEWVSERMMRNQLAILISLRDGVSPENYPGGAASYIGDFWEGVAALVRAGHVDGKLVYEWLGGSCRSWWTALAPFMRRSRSEGGDPKVYEHFEWLAGVMAEMDRKAGVTNPFDDAHLIRNLRGAIQNFGERLRVAEELRAVIVRPMSPALPEAPPPIAPDAAAPAGQPA